MYYHILFGLLSWIVVAAGALQIQFPPGQPVAATDSPFTWKRDPTDPGDFFLQKIKLDDPNGITGKSEHVLVPNAGSVGGEGQIFFRRAGLFSIIAVDSQTDRTFFNQQYTVQLNPTSAGAIISQATGNASQSVPGPQSTGNCHHNHRHCDGDDDDGGGSNNQMNMKNDNGSSSNPPSNAKSDIPIIVGSVLGTVAFMFLVTAIFMFLRYRRRRQTSNFQRNMMFRSPGSIQPWAISAPFDVEKSKEFMPSAYSQSSRSSRSSSSSRSQSDTYAPSQPPGLKIMATSPTDTVGSSVSQRRPNEPRGPRSQRLSDGTTTLTEGSNSSGSIVAYPAPTLSPRTRTTRQMMIEEDIQELQAKIIALQGRGDLSGIDKIERDEELKLVIARVETLKALHEGPWALGETETIPSGLF